MKANLELLVFSFSAIVLTLSGVPFFGDRTLYWAGEIVGEATRVLIGLVLIVAGLASALRAGMVARERPTFRR